jgi:hypothetical protein
MVERQRKESNCFFVLNTSILALQDSASLWPPGKVKDQFYVTNIQKVNSNTPNVTYNGWQRGPPAEPGVH